MSGLTAEPLSPPSSRAASHMSGPPYVWTRSLRSQEVTETRRLALCRRSSQGPLPDKQVELMQPKHGSVLEVLPGVQGL